MQKVLMHLVSLVLPANCVGCGTGGEGLLCERCRGEITLIPAHCTRCAEPLPSGFHHLCGGCITRRLHIDHALTLYPYSGVLREVLISFKSRGSTALWREVRGLLVDGLCARDEQGVVGPFREADAVVPIPLHWRRIWNREFNQSLWIAREVGNFLGIPVNDALRRTRFTPKQRGKGLAERRKNVKGAFEVLSSVKGNRLVLVDDIATSLATADEAARVLKIKGAQWVGIFTLARTLRWDQHA